MEKQNDTLSIDVRSVIRGKSPALARWLPGFVVRYLEHILHQEEINHILSTYGHLSGLEMAKAVLDYLEIVAIPHGLNNIHNDGRYIFVSNHPLGGLDGLVLINTIGQRFPQVRFIVNDFLMHIKPFEDIFIPINKHGRQNTSYAKQIHDAYDSDSQMLYFPAGLCSRKRGGVISDLPWKRNVLQKAIRYQRDIVPLFFSGQNSNFFYNLANIRKWLHIPFNLEMLYLADEMFRQKGARFNLFFGPPIPHSSFTNEKSLDDWMLDIRCKVYYLPELLLKTVPK
ncbi:MAG: 1-acyl-sn-glycerol-3-phosphate acyltransferase [Prevotellaceae bacterium]|jgi:putative hemolysin|nr:1-acyl-sn-glycerol-3-phosphate acyltransferase [Prevotellaceae bacterium]